MSLTWGYKMISLVFIIFTFTLDSCVAQTKELDKRMYNSEDAEDGQFKYAVFIVSQKEILCTGSLIEESWVLTAAHCISKDVNPSDIVIFAGKAKLHDYVMRMINGKNVDITETESHVQERIASRAFVHPFYYGNSHDIALVKTVKPFVLTGYVDVIPLATEPMNTPTSCTLAGYGRVEGDINKFVLHFIRDIHAKPGSYCKKLSIDHLICLDETNRGICSGDSGGPMVCEGTIRGVAMGSYTNSEHCGIETIEQYYTSTQHHFLWIFLTMLFF